MADSFSNVSPEALVSQATGCVAITASTTPFAATRGLFINARGDFGLTFLSGTDVTLTLDPGVYPFRIIRVTSGTGAFALY